MRVLIVLAVLLGLATPVATAQYPTFTDAANAVCAKYGKLGKRLGSPDLSRDRVARRYFTRAARLARRQTRDLAALQAPPAQRPAYKRFVAAGRDGAQLLRQLAKAVGNDDRSRRLLTRLGPISERVNATAKKLDLDRCGSGG